MKIERIINYKDIKRRFFGVLDNMLIFLKWFILSVVTGIVVGGYGILFAKLLTLATEFRSENRWIILFLPIAGCLIVFIYRFFKYGDDKGTNLVLSTIHAKAEIPLRMAPLIFVSTIITHLFGGSAGREGAALQMGGSLGNQLGRWFRLDAKGRRVLVMSGMSAAFAALFGTPIAAAVFAMEVVSVGVMQYSALVPCVFSAFIASKLAIDFGVMPERFKIMNIPDITYMILLKVIVLVIVCAGISVLLCMVLHTTGDIFKKYFKNPYLRILVAGCIIVGLTFVFGLDYCGAGMPVIEEAVAHGVAKPEAFILKMLFTALTIGAGYKGGEIVPSFFIGATFGCALGGIIGFDASMGAAIGMIAVFCGVTNSPITSLLIAFELFGFEGAPYFLITISIAYLLSGYYGLYHDQTIVYSKYSTERINVKAVGNINKHSESD